MGVVIDEIESTVEPESGRPATGGGSGQAPPPFTSDRVEAEIVRSERRQARLRAD